MPSINEIFVDADVATAAVQHTEDREQYRAMRRFMDAFERLGMTVLQGNATWADARPCALRVAARLIEAGHALAIWETEMATDLYHGGEEEAERALNWRSQHAVARELLCNTPASELLASRRHPDRAGTSYRRARPMTSPSPGTAFIPTIDAGGAQRDDLG